MKLFKKPKSKFYWYDFTVRGRRYRGSTQETKSVRTPKTASLKLASVMENTDPFQSKPTALGEFTERFLACVDNGRMEEKTKKFYRNGWRLLKATPVSNARVDQITGDCAEQLKFPGSWHLGSASRSSISNLNFTVLGKTQLLFCSLPGVEHRIANRTITRPKHGLRSCLAMASVVHSECTNSDLITLRGPQDQSKAPAKAESKSSAARGCIQNHFRRT